MTPVLPRLEELAERFGDPRVHPNGFIQLDIDAGRRLNVWHPRLPYRQRTYHPVHDHVFGFTSHCYSGRLVNVAYTLEPHNRGTHTIWRVRATASGEESMLFVLDGPGPMRLVHRHCFVVQPGESYDFPPFEFHESLSNEPTLTIMEKTSGTLKGGPNSDGASVAVPLGVSPDNDFRRDAVDTDVLWELIAEAHPCP